MVTPAELPAWLRRLYPFVPKALECGPARMSYVDEGPRVDEAVLLVHGNPTWSFYYRELIGRLVTAGMRCIAPDHIGMGLSEKPQDYPYCLETHIANLTRLVDALGLRRVHLVVHDWGGAIGFGWAVRHPGMTGRIVILNTGAFPARRMPFRIGLCRVPLLGEAIVRGLNGFAGPATWMAVKRRPLPPDVKRGYLFPYDSWKNRIGVARFVADIPMNSGHPTMKTLEHVAAGLAQFRSHPVRIVWGGADFCFNDWFFKRWQAIYPEAQTEYLPGAGHYVLEDAGVEVLPRILEFLGAEETG
jgi:cis-3-alkyl-4-acyloxetan-2-one decarboxylase